MGKMRSPWRISKKEEKKLNKVAETGLIKGKAKMIKIK